MKTLVGLRISAIAALALAASSAWAGDNIQVNVVTGVPEPVLKLNGNDTTQGTIQLFYLVEAYSFPVGEYATFRIDMEALHLTGQTNAVYAAPLELVQNGSNNLVLDPEVDSFDVTHQGWTGSTMVHVRIPADVPNEDGTNLVGNLNFRIPGSNKIGTPTSVQVHVRLAHPSACLKMFNFITDTDLETIYDSMTVSVNTNKGWVSSTHPSQVSDNVLIANTCSWDETFDLRITLDPRFNTSPNGSPGNAVHTYVSAGIVEDGDFDISAFGTGSGQGQSLCLQNVTVSAGTSFLAAVHSALIHHLPLAQLEPSPFNFAAGLAAPNTSCTGLSANSVTVNPVTLAIPFSVN